MEAKQQTRLHFTGVNITNVDFKSFNQYDNEREIKLSVDCKVFYPEDEPSDFRLLMTVGMHCPDFFEFKALGVGHFNIESDVDQGQRSAFVNMNAPAIMFPYMRSFVSTMTANLGSTTSGSLLIPTHFFRGDLEEFRFPNE